MDSTDAATRAWIDHTIIRALACDPANLDASDAARRLVARVSDEDLRAFAVAYVTDEIDQYRRRLVRQTEAESTAPHPPVTVQFVPRYDDSNRVRFESYRDNPTRKNVPLNLRDRKAFKRWMGGEFDVWRQTSEQALIAAGDEDDLDDFRADWHPDGVKVYYRQNTVRRLFTIAEEMAEQVRLEVTAELMASTFALGDGRRVTWGDATVAEHRQRVDMLTEIAGGTVETAARHLAAIRMIETSHARCLADLPATEGD